MTQLDSQLLIRQFIAGDPVAIAGLLDRAETSTEPTVLVAAALISGTPDGLAHALRLATSSRDRQLIGIASAHLAGDRSLVDALVREHLLDHPDNILAAWIAGADQRSDTPREIR
jgi:hypothetical protein